MKDMILINVDSESSICIPNMPLVHEIGLIGAGIGGGFDNASDLRQMKHNKAVNGPDKEKWAKAIDEEWERMVKNIFLRLLNVKMCQKTRKS